MAQNSLPLQYSSDAAADISGEPSSLAPDLGASETLHPLALEETLLAALKESAAEVTMHPSSADPRLLDLGPVRTAEATLAVVAVRSVEAVQARMRWAHEHRVPVTARGKGTGLSGGANAVAQGVVLDLSPMNRILELQPLDQTALVEPGVINADLDAAAAEHGLMYAPDPASFRLSTIGGNVSTNAGGLRCAKYGVTRDSVLGLDVVLADGTLIRTGSQTFKFVVGYDLTGLMVGAEGTLGIVVGIRVRLRPRPIRACQLVVAFSSVAGAAQGVIAIGEAGVQPSIVEFLDHATLQSLDTTEGTSLSQLGQAILLVETDGFGAEPEREAVIAAVEAVGGRIVLRDEDAKALIDLRRQARGDMEDQPLRVGEDIAVPRSQLVTVVERLEACAAVHQVNLKMVAHAGDGNLHPTFWLPEPGEGESIGTAVERLEAALDESVGIALELGGTVSGEHGVGLYKRRWVAWEQDEALIRAQHALKRALDPRGILNPGKALGLFPQE